ncbi:hypothetical protein AB4Z52_19745 [Rhizobium sp. 2YAF20]|uniref:hypothetical protein n=1 Tax=Rhizobium sp. 2YAF20 TaxID=3233027 RepID=UPI003F96FA0A
MSVYNFTSVNIAGYEFVNVVGVSASGLEAIEAEHDGTDKAYLGQHGNYSAISTAGISVGVSGIDEHGDAFGWYSAGLQGQGTLSGFIDNYHGTVGTISYPGSGFTQVTGYDSYGHVVGNYTASDSTQHGFSYYNGSYTSLSFGSTSTTVGGTNTYGEVFGQYHSGSSIGHGFVYSTLGGFYQVDFPGAVSTTVTGDESLGGVVTGGPDFGKAVGRYIDSAGRTHGFIDQNGSISTLDVPGATDTFVSGTNDSGDIAGDYTTASGLHGFVYENGVFYKFDVPGSSGTMVNGINDEGQFYGNYNANGANVGFVGSLSLGEQHTSSHSNDIARSGDVTGPYNVIDLLNLEASWSDLIKGFGNNSQAMQNWYNNSEPTEHRTDTFDGLDYIASYADLTVGYRSAGSQQALLDVGASHFINHGTTEGRVTSFNGLDYIASYSDLSRGYGANGDAGAFHYIEHGSLEGRKSTFDGLDYIASYKDLAIGLGTNEQDGAAHFIQHGLNEGRTTTFDGLDYIAGYADLMAGYGADNDAGATHYIAHGLNEGRSAKPFDVVAYFSAHPDLNGKFSSTDAFLTAYINTYNATGSLIT